VETSATELKHGTTQVVVINHTGFTQKLEQGGTLEEGEIISSTVISDNRDCDDKPEESIAVNTVTVESWRNGNVLALV